MERKALYLQSDSVVSAAERKEINQMSSFNRQQIDGFLYGIYVCSVCGGLMRFTDKFEDELYCEKCGHLCRIEDYGQEKSEYDEDGNFIVNDRDAEFMFDEADEPDEDEMDED